MKNNLFVRDKQGNYSISDTVTRSDIIAFAYQLLVPEFASNQFVSRPVDCVGFLKIALADLEREKFGIILLSARNQVIKFEILSVGTLDMASIHPREILRIIFENNAHSIILSHNHPSGDVTPSDADIRLTKRIQSALKLVDVVVRDHIIVGHNNFYSFSECGVLPL